MIVYFHIKEIIIKNIKKTTQNFVFVDKNLVLYRKMVSRKSSSQSLKFYEFNFSSEDHLECTLVHKSMTDKNHNSNFKNILYIAYSMLQHNCNIITFVIFFLNPKSQSQYFNQMPQCNKCNILLFYTTLVSTVQRNHIA